MTDTDGLEAGLAGSVTHTVTSDDTAIAHGSGDVPVLATPRVVALAEEAACTALVGHLDPDHTTVGVRIELDHLRPTQVGGEVTAAATLEDVDGRKLTFVVSVREDDTEVARGTHRRVVVARERFAG
ncbi:thioesterase family protein [Euzebya rosea]|uniref:thioesterase family protein n=1 Tax=Euzebya rosea TaxID=2052804 RepID=UPI000D3EDC9B|nr:hotdog domain-containing protein [Euzebya rosea]